MSMSVAMVHAVSTADAAVLVLQNYKETCTEIAYDCSTDTITARCGGQSDNAQGLTSLADASECYDSIRGKPGNIGNISGDLECQLGTQA